MHRARRQLHPTDDTATKHIYSRIIILGLLLHLSQTVIFTLLSCPLVAYYNAASVIFYCFMLFFAHREWFRLAVSCIHVEVCLFSAVCTVLCGWDLWLPLYLLAISSLVYFCPFDHKYVPYLFSCAEFFVFIFLRVYTNIYPAVYTIDNRYVLWLSLYSAVACFCIILYAAFSSNISATVTNRRLQAENRNLTLLADHDMLTGLLSRRAFLSKISACPAGTPICVAFCDIDSFKRINDTYGHAMGDQVLYSLSQLFIHHCSRKITICRWGGEEFVLFFRGMTLEEACEVMDSLLAKIRTHTFQCGQKTFSVTMTAGLCAGLADAAIQPMIELADARMYWGKEHGKDQLVTEDSIDG